MKKKLIFLLVCFVSISPSFAQQLPLNMCGIVHIYDASGNRVKRIYFCNNGTEPYLSRTVNPASLVSSVAAEPEGEKPTANVVFQQIDALYPNPTTGRFSVTFSKALQNARIYITDLNGKVIRQMTGSGYKVDFNLSSQAKGVYFINIHDGLNRIVQKVVKQ